MMYLQEVFLGFTKERIETEEEESAVVVHMIMKKGLQLLRITIVYMLGL